MNPSIEVGKRLIRQQVSADLAEKLAALRKANPALSLQQVWAQLEVSEPKLIAFAAKVEADQWETPRPEPVFRYTETGKQLPSTASVKTALRSLMPQKVEAVDDDRELLASLRCRRLDHRP